MDKFSSFHNGSSLPLMRRLHVLVLLTVLFLKCSVSAADQFPTVREWTVEGHVRQALVYAPSKTQAGLSPIVFAFHGHGGSMKNAARSFGYHQLWPEAVVVYMQGLNTPGRLTDPDGQKPGWQSGIGDQADRDIKFFDIVLEDLKHRYMVDENRIFATGHSNGGGFTYLLWAMRGDRFAAFAPSGSAAVRVFQMLKPKPVFHVAGEHDPLVKFAWQKQMMDGLRQLNHCTEGQPCGKFCTRYPSTIGAPVLTFIHPGGHAFPTEAAAAIVTFFKEQTRKN